MTLTWSRVINKEEISSKLTIDTLDLIFKKPNIHAHEKFRRCDLHVPLVAKEFHLWLRHYTPLKPLIPSHNVYFFLFWVLNHGGDWIPRVWIYWIKKMLWCDTQNAERSKQVFPSFLHHHQFLTSSSSIFNNNVWMC
jgi:hypothetical protein